MEVTEGKTNEYLISREYIDPNEVVRQIRKKQFDATHPTQK